jgi:predicted metal-dependent peptidase
MSMQKNTTLSEKKAGPVTVTDPKIDASAVEKLVTARISLLLKAPFFGNLATRLQLVNADDRCPTAATDGRKFYYNSKFVHNMPMKQVEFLFGHETLHNVYDHMSRRLSRDPKIWNIACDFCVNGDLIEQRIGEKITVVGILHDIKYKGMSAEEVYDDLMKNADKLDIDEMARRVLDEHMDTEDMSDEERREIRDEISEAVMQAAQACGASNLPGGVKRMLKELTEPQISWQELLEQQIQSTIKSDFSWARPSRKGWGIDAILPGMTCGTTIDVCCAIDQSGSISAEDSQIFLSEVKGIMDSYTDCKVRLWCFDTEIYNDQSFTSDSMSELLEYQPMGCGGTDFEANYRYMVENDIQPKKFIMFTDGVPNGGWGDENYCDTVFIIKGNPGAQPPFGVWAHYENHATKK